MVAGSRLYRVSAEISDADRAVFEHVEFRIARHPSESDEYLLTRMLAYCLEYAPGLEFPPGGLSARGTPALWVRAGDGPLESWIEVGLPEPRRIAKAMRSASNVIIYAFRDPSALLRQLAKQPRRSGVELVLHALDRRVLESLVHVLVPRTELSVRREGARLLLEVAGERTETRLATHHPLDD